MSGRNKAVFPTFFPCFLLLAALFAEGAGDWEQLPQGIPGFWIWNGGSLGLLLQHLGVPDSSGVSKPSLIQGQIKWVHSRGVKQVWAPSLGCGMHPAGTNVSPTLCQEQGGGDSPRRGDSSPAGLCHTSAATRAPPAAPTGLSSLAGSWRAGGTRGQGKAAGASLPHLVWLSLCHPELELIIAER